MNRTSKTLRLAAVASASALVLAACGGSDDAETEDDTGAIETEADGVLTFGSLLPATGNLAFLGPPEFAGVDLAVQEINEAGGVLGEEVVHVRGDSGDATSGIAPTETDALLRAGSDVIIGAASSGVTMTVIDKIMSSGVVMFSPANTSTAFDLPPYDGEDLYFRTAPSDILQGAVMANLLVQDGRQNVALLSLQDPYGETLVNEVTAGLEAAGSSVSATVFYDQAASSFDSQISEVEASSPDALVLIAFDETVRIIPQLIAAGIGPSSLPTYFVDGNTADYSADSDPNLPPGTLLGTKGTLPGADTTGEFRARLDAIDPNLTSYAYAAEAYDAVIVSALAAVVADSDDGEAIAAEIVDVTTGGTKCTTFAECVELLDAGEDIDYDGASGPIELGETGSPTAAYIGIYEYDEENRITAIEFIEGQI